MLTSDLYAKHMLPAKPEGECSGSDSIHRGMLEGVHCSSHLSVQSHVHALSAAIASFRNCCAGSMSACHLKRRMHAELTIPTLDMQGQAWISRRPPTKSCQSY